MKLRFVVLLLFCAFLPPAAHAKLFGSGYDLVLQGSPISIKEMQAGTKADALDGTAEDTETRHVVLFKVERVLVGELAKIKRGGPGRLDQAGDSIKSKQVLGIFALKDPEEMLERETFSVAVKNPGETFGMTPGEPVPSRSYKLYFIRVSKSPEAFVFVKAKPVKS